MKITSFRGNSNTTLVIFIEAVIGSVVGASVIIVILLIMCFKKRKVLCKKRSKKNKKEKKQTNQESMKKHFVENPSNNWATRTGQKIKKYFIAKSSFDCFSSQKRSRPPTRGEWLKTPTAPACVEDYDSNLMGDAQMPYPLPGETFGYNYGQSSKFLNF